MKNRYWVNSGTLTLDGDGCLDDLVLTCEDRLFPASEFPEECS